MVSPARPHPAAVPSAREVFEILVRQHTDMLTVYLRSLVTRSDLVDDLFQETMIIAWRRLADYDHNRPFGPWLRGIAARLVLAHHRTSARDAMSCDPAVLEALDRQMTTFEHTPADSFADRMHQLRACLDKLPERFADVITLAYGRGLMLKEIATVVKATEEAVKKRVQRARRALTDCLGLTGDAS